MSPSALPPKSFSQRVELIDALRGFALFGICLVHCISFFELYALKPNDEFIHNIIVLLFSGKAYAIFALLFGVSFFIIIDSLRRKGGAYHARFAWRMLLLIVMGYAHTLVYHGDILFILGVLGFLLLVMNTLSSRTLIVISVLFAIQIPFLLELHTLWNKPEMLRVIPHHWHLYETLRTFHGENTSLIAHMIMNGTQGLITKCWYFIEDPRGMQLVSLLLVGVVLGRTGFFNHRSALSAQRFYMLALLLITSLIFYFARRYASDIATALSTNALVVTPMLEKLMNIYLNYTMMGVWVVSFCMLYQWRKTHTFLHLLAPCGRMSLTLYLLQSLVGIPVFYTWGLGWYESVSAYEAALFGVGFYVSLMVFAHCWMANFHFGPAEWLWRAATYKTFNIPFRKNKQASSDPSSVVNAV